MSHARVPLGRAARPLRPPLTLPLPSGPLATRLTLAGLALALQNALELPREGITALLGAGVTSLLVVGCLAGSLVLLLLAVRRELPRWRWLRARQVRLAVLGLTLLACGVGVRQIGALALASVQPPQYFNDGTTLDHYAAQELLAGRNPYVTTDIVAAVRQLKQAPEHTTPLRQGAFAHLAPEQYPTAAQMRAAFAEQPVGAPERVVSFETHVSYPALAVLPLVPFVWAGLPNVVPFFALCLLALGVLLVIAVPVAARPWMVVLFLADAPLLNAALTGSLDVFAVLLLFVAWRWWRRPLLSTVFLGLALAAKQLAWFALPFYLLLIWHARGWRAAALRLAGAAGVFALLNGPFILWDAGAWLRGVLAPLADPMFPLGSGLVRLSLGGLLPLAPQVVYTALEALALLAALVWFAREGERRVELAVILAVLPLFFAWRSLTTYFYFATLPALALWLATARITAPQPVPLTWRTLRGLRPGGRRRHG